MVVVVVFVVVIIVSSHILKLHIHHLNKLRHYHQEPLNFRKNLFLNDPTSFLNDPDLFGQYSLVIVFLLSSFHFIPKIRSILRAVFKNLGFESTIKRHFELILLNDPELQKFRKIRHFNIFTCGFRQKFTNLPNFHFINDFSQYLSSLFVKVQQAI